LRDDEDVRDCKEILDKDIIFVLVYCPFREIEARLIKRNMSGVKNEQRTLYQAVDQFADIFAIEKKQVFPTLDRIKKEHVMRIFRSLKLELARENIKRKARKKDERNISKILTDLERNLLLGKDETFVTTRIDKKTGKQLLTYDAIGINSSASGPTKTALTIFQKINQQCISNESLQKVNSKTAAKVSEFESWYNYKSTNKNAGNAETFSIFDKIPQIS
jgi:hypothetical protein